MGARAGVEWLVFTVTQFTSGLVLVERPELQVAVGDCSTVPVLFPLGIWSAVDTPPMGQVVWVLHGVD